jgi:ABC-type tungstate transport system substrate-binding protein
MLTWVGVVLAIKAAWIAGVPATLAALVAGALGAGTALAYLRFLRQADELRRKIELEALALAYGTGIVGGLTYWTLGLAGVVGEADLFYVLAAMLLVHPIAVFVGQRRYA